jgi:hypothetical protein
MIKLAPDWLERNQGSTWVRLYWLAEDLRASQTKAERLRLAAALDELSTELMLKEPNTRRGRPMHPDTWRRFAIAEALVDRLGIKPSAAALAACGGEKKIADAVRQIFVRQKKGKPLGLRAFNEGDYAIAERRLIRIHRIK